MIRTTDDSLSRPARSPALSPETALVASALAPTVFSRNRNWALFRDPALNEARKRGRVVRSLLLELRKHGSGLTLQVQEEGERVRLSYSVTSLQLSRSVLLAQLEYHCLCKLAERANLGGLKLSNDGKAELERILLAMAPTLAPR
jgi:hypothetical protein